MQKVFIVMKNGTVYPTRIESLEVLHKLLNEGGSFLLLANKWSINKFEISHTFLSGENPILEKIANHPIWEQEIFWGIIKQKKAMGFPVKSYDGLINAYSRMKQEKTLDKLWTLPFSVDLFDENLSLTYNQDGQD